MLGARLVLNSWQGKQGGFSRWALNLHERRGYWKSVIAIVAKNARRILAVLHYGDTGLTNEVIVCVFHQGLSYMLNMTDCSLAVLHFLAHQQSRFSQGRM